MRRVQEQWRERLRTITTTTTCGRVPLDHLLISKHTPPTVFSIAVLSTS
jgi:hypothetical protein